MNKRKVAVLLLVVIVSCMMLTISVSYAQQQAPTLDQSFLQAIRTDGFDYVNARNTIIAKEGVIPFLKSKCSDPDWHIRILAQSMIGRIEDPEQYTAYEYQTVWVAGGVAPHGGATFYDLYRLVHPGFGSYASDSDIASALVNRSSRKEEFGISGAPFLAEVALKGSILKKPAVKYTLPSGDLDSTFTVAEVAKMLNINEKLASQWMRSCAEPQGNGGPPLVKLSCLKTFVNTRLKPDTSTSAVNSGFRESARCWAMLMLADCFNDDPVTIPVLVELLQSKESTKIRGYAALALGISGMKEAKEPLNIAQNDSDKQVSEAAQKSLVTLQHIMEVQSKKELKY